MSRTWKVRRKNINPNNVDTDVPVGEVVDSSRTVVIVALAVSGTPIKVECTCVVLCLLHTDILVHQGAMCILLAFFR